MEEGGMPVKEALLRKTSQDDDGGRVLTLVSFHSMR